MKFTFICIVIVITCGTCASGDLEIYPDLRSFLNDHRRLHRRTYTQFRYPWQNSPIEEYGDIENSQIPQHEGLPNRLRIEQIIEWERAQLKHKHDQMEKAQNYGSNNGFDFRIPNIPEEVRVYPQDEDIGFDNTDIDQGAFGHSRFAEKSDIEKPKVELGNDADFRGMHHEEHHGDEIGEKGFTSGRFQNVEFVKDPNSFAYAPSDSRFYGKIESAAQRSTLPPPPSLIKTINKPILDGTLLTTDKLKITVRSDQRDQDDTDTTDAGYRPAQFELNQHRIALEPEVEMVKSNLQDVDTAGMYVIAIVAGISAAATVGLIAVGIGWYNLQKHVKNSSDTEYPAYGVTGPNKDVSPSGDRRLGQSAQMYHYQHQKQQIIAMERVQPDYVLSRAQPGERHGSVSEAESDEENEEGDYTVYECPGLAPTGEMEVKNPLFQDDPTPAQTPAVKSTDAEEKK